MTGTPASAPLAAPVIAIDGPSGSGKGTIARHVAAHLGFHLLDSGALYRLVALVGSRVGVAVHAERICNCRFPQRQRAPHSMVVRRVVGRYCSPAFHVDRARGCAA